MPANQQALVLREVEEFIEKGQLANAIAILNQTLKQTPEFYQAWLKLSECLYKAGYSKQAIDVLTHAENFDPLRQEFEQIKYLIQKTQYNEAVKAANAMLARIPHHPRAVFTLAHVAITLDDSAQSANLLKGEIAHLPANISLRFMLIDSFVQSDQYHEALESAKKLVELHESFDTLWKYIGLLLKYSQIKLLLEKCEQALTLVKNDKIKESQVALVKGQALRIMGEREASIQTLKMSIHADSNNVDAWAALADMKNYVFSEHEIEQIKHLANNRQLSSKAKGITMFSLAKAVEVKNGISYSISLYEQANRLVGSDPRYIDLMFAEFEKRKKSYTKEALSIQAKAYHEWPRPIFIVGLPRSGSTLVEQILASHSQIEATVEQPTLAAIERQTEKYCQQKYRRSLNECLENLTTEELAAFGQDYLDKGALFREQNTAYFVDKQPFNYRLIGFIHKILPDALIINVRRNSMDCGLSLYKQYFHSAADFSFDLKHIAQAINAYQELMRYWQKQIPDRVIHIQYEKLVDSPDEQIANLFNQLSIEFETSCLSFYKNARKVHTASSEQVRQPLNSNSINLWTKVEANLQILSQNLLE